MITSSALILLLGSGGCLCVCLVSFVTVVGERDYFLVVLVLGRLWSDC